MAKCYNSEVINYSRPLFTTIETCIILTMRNSERRSSYMQQLEEFRPCRNVIIQHNAGYRMCPKGEEVSNIDQDLLHAMKHALENVSGPVLVFEDDFKFLPRLRAEVAKVEEFVRENAMDAYALGCMPHLAYHTMGHVRVLRGGCCHAMLYTDSGIKKILSQTASNDEPLDTKFYRDSVIYTSPRPLAVQAHGGTENAKQMAAGISKWLGVSPETFLLPVYSSCGVDGTMCYEFFHLTTYLGGLSTVCTMLVLLVIFVIRAGVRRMQYRE